MKRSLPDAHDRELAVQDFLRNLCVTAGAGAGKTSLLVERILFAVLVHDIPLARIVAITFTEKAAAELRDRLLTALEDIRRSLEADPADHARPTSGEADRVLQRLAAALAEGADAIARRCRTALLASHQLTTIHGFAAAILRRWPQRAGLAAELRIDDGTRWRQFVLEAWPRVLSQALEGGAQTTAFQSVLRHLDLADLRELVVQLGEQPGRPVGWKGVERLLHTEIRPLHEELQAFRAALTTTRRIALPGTLSGHAGVWGTLLKQGVQAAQRRLIEDPELLAGLDRTLRIPGSAKGIDPDRCLHVLRRSQRMLRDLLTVEDEACEQALGLAGELADSLWDEFRRAGWITFQGLLSHARLLLGSDEEVRRSEAGRFDLLLLDEFQDTDPLQCELAFLLCAEPDAACADPWQARLVAGKLFLVGDPKQSIYRFRGADLQVYHQAVEHVLSQGGRALTLTTNFRSHARIVEPLNELFAPYFGARSRSEPGFERMQAIRNEPAAHGVELWCVGTSGAARARDGRRAEGRLVAQQIAALRDAGTPLGGMAILLRSLENLTLYLRPLREAGIPCVVDGGRTFAERGEVNELYAVIQSACDPEDEAAFLGALRSSLFHVTDAEMARFAATASAFRWSEGIAASDHPGIRRASQQLSRWHAQLKDEPVAAVVQSIVQDSPLLAISASAYEGAERMANQQKLAHLIDFALSDSSLSLSEGLRDLLRALEFGPGESERSLADEQVEAVRILSIHKSKGLEYPVVFLPDLARQETTPYDPRPRFHALRTAQGCAAGIFLPRARRMNSAMLLQRQWDEEHQAAETKRLLYVAMTRARDRLILLTYSPTSSGPWLRALEPAGFDPGHPGTASRRLLDGRLPLCWFEEADISAPDSDLQPHREDLLPSVAHYHTLADQLRSRAPRLARPSGAEEAYTSPSLRPGGGPGRAFSQRLGTLCHRVLAQTGPRPVSPEEIRAAARALPFEAGVQSELARAAEEVLCSADAGRLLAELTEVTVLAREIPLLLQDGDTCFRGAADLIYEQHGAIVVADYKTDQPEAAEILAQRYAGQLAVYCQAVQRALGRATPPAAELLLLRTGQRIRIKDSQANDH